MSSAIRNGLENDLKTYIDKDTGTQMAVVNMHYYEVRSKKQLQGFQKKLEDERVIKKRGKNYVNCFDEPIKQVVPKAKGNELGALFVLLHFMQLNKDGLLLKNGKPATISDIADRLGKKERRTKEIICRLVELGLINKGGDNTRNTTYSISGDYFIMGGFDGGKDGKGMFSRLYQLQSRGQLKNITLEDADILLRILPYFHFQKYYLCSNPYERDTDKIHHLNETELAKIIGVHRNTLINRMKNLIRAGYIFKGMGIGNAYFFQVNPDIMTREIDPNSHDARVLRQHFAELAKIDEKEQISKELGLN